MCHRARPWNLQARAQSLSVSLTFSQSLSLSVSLSVSFSVSLAVSLSLSQCLSVYSPLSLSLSLSFGLFTSRMVRFLQVEVGSVADVHFEAGRLSREFSATSVEIQCGSVAPVSVRAPRWAKTGAEVPAQTLESFSLIPSMDACKCSSRIFGLKLRVTSWHRCAWWHNVARHVARMFPGHNPADRSLGMDCAAARVGCGRSCPGNRVVASSTMVAVPEAVLALCSASVT